MSAVAATFPGTMPMQHNSSTCVLQLSYSILEFTFASHYANNIHCLFDPWRVVKGANPKNLTVDAFVDRAHPLQHELMHLHSGLARLQFTSRHLLASFMQILLALHTVF
jgi:hypothetical protein